VQSSQLKSDQGACVKESGEHVCNQVSSKVTKVHVLRKVYSGLATSWSPGIHTQAMLNFVGHYCLNLASCGSGCAAVMCIMTFCPKAAVEGHTSICVQDNTNGIVPGLSHTRS
jgi:hypothetical protein